VIPELLLTIQATYHDCIFNSMCAVYAVLTCCQCDYSTPGACNTGSDQVPPPQDGFLSCCFGWCWSCCLCGGNKYQSAHYSWVHLSFGTPRFAAPLCPCCRRMRDDLQQLRDKTVDLELKMDRVRQAASFLQLLRKHAML